MTAGVTSAAMAGLGTLMLTATESPEQPRTTQVQLVNDEEEFVLWGMTIGDRAAATTEAITLRPLIGNGGWLIGNGRDAAADCTGDACNGGNGGLLGGN
ncbi:MAG: hypothetical protein WA944_11830, partial [Mycobacterium sp.]